MCNKICGEKNTNLDPNLFIPPIARRLEERADLTLNMKQWSESEEDLRSSKHVLKRKY